MTELDGWSIRTLNERIDSMLYERSALSKKPEDVNRYATDYLWSQVLKPANLSQIIARLNELFITDGLSDKDLINYAYSIRDKISENAQVMRQIVNNSPEQAVAWGESYLTQRMDGRWSFFEIDAIPSSSAFRAFRNTAPTPLPNSHPARMPRSHRRPARQTIRAPAPTASNPGPACGWPPG